MLYHFPLMTHASHLSLILLVLSNHLSLNEARAEEKSSAKPLQLYVSAHGFVNGSFISEPSDKTVSEYPGYLIPYPGFGGVGGGGGAEFGVNWKALSLDLGFDYSADQAEGRLNGQALTLSQTTYHLPLTIRLSLPQAKLVRPSLFGGIDWVTAADTQLDAKYFSGIEAAESESYTGWRFGFGFEVFLSNTLSIPFRVQAVYAPMNNENLDDRVEIVALNGGTLTSYKIKSKWEWQPQVSLGFTYYFGQDALNAKN